MTELNRKMAESNRKSTTHIPRTLLAIPVNMDFSFSNLSDTKQASATLRGTARYFAFWIYFIFGNRLVLNLSLFLSPLEKIKFLCKDLWPSIYHKAIDNLKTNHKGVYLLEDYLFKPFVYLNMSSGTNPMGSSTNPVNSSINLDDMFDEELAQKAIPVHLILFYGYFSFNFFCLVFGLALWCH